MKFLLPLCLCLLLWLMSWGGCSTSQVEPSLPVPPDLTQVPHPQGNSLADISAIFEDHSAPKLSTFTLNCHLNFLKLIAATASKEEINQGAKELVRANPVFYHWCFYGKLLKLEDDLKKDNFIEERQKDVLDTYQFLTSIAKAFVSEFQDSRYLRMAVMRYQKTSEWIFFRKLELTPQATLDLVQPLNPFGLWRKSQGGFLVLEKYHIVEQQNKSTLQNQPVLSVSAPTPVLTTPLSTPSVLPSLLFPLPTPELSPAAQTFKKL